MKVGNLEPRDVVSFYTFSAELVAKLTATSTILEWDGHNQFGLGISSGIYLYAVQRGDKVVKVGKFLVSNS